MRIKHRVVLSLIGTIFSSGAIASEISTQIVNGTDADVSHYVNFASLFTETDRGHSSSSFCGATIINDTFILTAAHCIVGNEANLPYVTVAPALQDESHYVFQSYPKVVEYYFPSTFVDSEIARWPDDIAILKLDSSIGRGDLYGMLNFTRDRGFGGLDIFTAVGHGRTNYLIDASQNKKLKEAPLLYVGNSICIAEHGPNITNKQICFSGVDGGAFKNAICSGDSGGPIYVSNNGGSISQVGIASFGYTKCGDDSKNVTSVFTDVYDYKGWIDSVIQGGVSPSYEVQVQNGSRVLVDNVSSGSSRTASSGDSGGSFSVNSLLSLLFVSFLVRFRRKASLGKK